MKSRSDFHPIIDGRYTLFHKHLPFSDFLSELLQIQSIASLVNSLKKLSKTDKLIDFVNFELLKNEEIKKIIGVKEPIKENIVTELARKSVLKIKVLEDFCKQFANSVIIIPVSNGLKQNYYETILAANYSSNVVQMVKFIQKTNLNPTDFSIDLLSNPVIVSHKPADFSKYPPNLPLVYFNNRFYNLLTKQKIEKNLKNVAFELDLLNFLPDCFELWLQKSRNPSTKTIKIGYFLLAKKIEDAFVKKIISPCFPLEFVPLDIRYPIENSDFDLVLHKITDLVKYLGPGKMKNQCEEHFREFYEKYKQKIRFIDGLEGIEVVTSRVLFQNFFEGLFLCEEFRKKIEMLPFKASVKVPKIIEIEPHAAFSNTLEKMKTSGLNFPIIAKTKQALGESKSHIMAIALDEKGLEKVEDHEVFSNEEHIIQELINHDETIFKVYVIGDKSYYYTRQSLPNVTMEVLGQSFFFFDSQVPFKEQMDFLKKRETDFKSHNVKIEQQLFDLMTSAISEKLGFSLYGYDLIKDSKTGEVHIVDINYFPGFKFEGDLKALFTDFYLKKMNKS